MVFTTFYLIPTYIYGTLLSSTGYLYIPMVLFLLHSTAFLSIPMVLYYLLLAHCLSLWYSTTSTGSLPIPMVFYYLLLAPCLSLWYYTIFYWPTAYHYGTLLQSSGPLPTLLSSTGYCLYLRYSSIFYCSLPILMVLFYLLLPSCLYLRYSTIFYWVHAYTHGTLLPSTWSLPIPMVLYYFLLTHCLCL